MVTVTGTTRRSGLRTRMAPVVATGGAVALVTVGLIGPDTGAITETAPVEVRVELVDRRPVEVVTSPVAAPTTDVTTSVVSRVVTTAVTTVVPTSVPSTSVVETVPATPAPTPTTTMPTDVHPLDVERWVAGDLPVPAAPGPADEAALRTTTQRAWTALLVARRGPGDPFPVSVGRSVRSGHAAQRFDDEVAAFARTGRRAVPDPGIPSAITVLDLGLIGQDRAVVVVCTIDSDVLVAIDGGPIADDAGSTENGITREVTRYGMVRADGGWLLDDVHTLDRSTFPSTDPEAHQRC